MDTLLVTLGVLGVGAMIVSTYVFTVAARKYVSDDNGSFLRANGQATPRFVERSRTDRRSGSPVSFPLMVNGILIERDRRQLADRRQFQFA